MIIYKQIGYIMVEGVREHRFKKVSPVGNKRMRKTDGC
jgi:hypothetical protein